MTSKLLGPAIKCPDDSGVFLDARLSKAHPYGQGKGTLLEDVYYVDDLGEIQQMKWQWFVVDVQSRVAIDVTEDTDTERRWLCRSLMAPLSALSPSVHKMEVMINDIREEEGNLVIDARYTGVSYVPPVLEQGQHPSLTSATVRKALEASFTTLPEGRTITVCKVRFKYSPREELASIAYYLIIQRSHTHPINGMQVYSDSILGRDPWSLSAEDRLRIIEGAMKRRKIEL